MRTRRLGESEEGEGGSEGKTHTHPGKLGTWQLKSKMRGGFLLGISLSLVGLSATTVNMTERYIFPFHPPHLHSPGPFTERFYRNAVNVARSTTAAFMLARNHVSSTFTLHAEFSPVCKSCCNAKLCTR
ncbi:hypothetical protein LX36DRAFT_14925 [Colletotrichum falcatum]|nr:hypothetical protein LX36DRAFT_14925 [Colletotrichum falcatum]